MILDLTDLPTPQALHEALAQLFHFPAYYGHNLDALYDCLSEMEEDITLTLQLPSWADGFREVFRDATQENEHLKITAE